MRASGRFGGKSSPFQTVFLERGSRLPLHLSLLIKTCIFMSSRCQKHKLPIAMIGLSVSAMSRCGTKSASRIMAPSRSCFDPLSLGKCFFVSRARPSPPRSLLLTSS